MNWKQEAKEKLRRYNMLKVALLNIPEEIARLKSEVSGIKSASADGTPVQGGGNKREDRMLENIMAREELKIQLARTKVEVKNIERGLSALDPTERHILAVMYINNERGGRDRLMGELNLKDETNLYKRAVKTLEKFTRCMYGCLEN